MKQYDIFISFFNSYPITSGASAVTTSIYKSWPRNKKLFMLNHEKKIYKKNIYNYKLFSNHFLIKTIFLFFYILFIYLKIRKDKINNIIFEGASWSGYIYISYLILKLLIPKSRYIYHAHNVDFFFRQKNFLISKISFFCEGQILKKFDLSTAVSQYDQYQFKRLFKIKTKLLPNGICIHQSKVKKNVLKKNYVIFSGSLEYTQNRKIFSKLLSREFKILNNYIPNLQICLTGGGRHKFYPNNKNIIELGTVEFKKYLSLLKKALLIVVPGTLSTGTKIKIIEALIYNKIVFAAPLSMKGINTSYNKHIVYKSTKDFKNKILNLKKSNFKLKIFNKITNFYRKKYDMNKIVSKFIYENKI